MVDLLRAKKCPQVIWPPPHHFPLTYFGADCADLDSVHIFLRSWILHGPWLAMVCLSSRSLETGEETRIERVVQNVAAPMGVAQALCGAPEYVFDRSAQVERMR